MKIKIIASIITIIFLITAQFFVCSAYGMYEIPADLGIVNEESFSDDDAVTRGECLTTIMKSIGVTDTEINKLGGADYIGFTDTSPYSYFGCAYASGIAYGEECVVDYPTTRTLHTLSNTDFFFFPGRAATAKECLAFMIRCLEGNDNKHLTYMVEKAKEYDLINEEDAFIDKIDSVINKDDFCTLLYRFLNQKRYKYYDRVDNVFRMEGNIDKERSMTYLEFLTQRGTNEK